MINKFSRFKIEKLLLRLTIVLLGIGLLYSNYLLNEISDDKGYIDNYSNYFEMVDMSKDKSLDEEFKAYLNQDLERLRTKMRMELEERKINERQQQIMSLLIIFYCLLCFLITPQKSKN